MDDSMSDYLEGRLKEKVLPILEKGRPGFNVPHALAAVHWMKELIKNEGGNPKILISAAYLHDVGYAGLITEKNYTIDQVMANRQLHMEKGAEMAGKILEELEAYNPVEIMHIQSLILVHDKIYQLNAIDEILLFEADTLGQMDLERVPKNLDKENYAKFYEHLTKERVPLFRTKSGKEYLNILLAKLPKPDEYVQGK